MATTISNANRTVLRFDSGVNGRKVCERLGVAM